MQEYQCIIDTGCRVLVEFGFILYNHNNEASYGSVLEQEYGLRYDFGVGVRVKDITTKEL